MFKELAARPANRQIRTFASTRKPVAAISRVLIAVALSAPLMLVGAYYEALAKPNAALRACEAKLGRCIADCTNKWTDPQFQRSCMSRCDVDFNRCSAKTKGGSKKEADPDPLRPKGTGGHTPPTGGAKDEPKAPPKVNDTRAPTGGAKDQPKSPPKVNDTRAPLGGGEKPPSSSGTSGPILRSGGTPAPIQKPNGGNGSSLKSNGRR